MGALIELLDHSIDIGVGIYPFTLALNAYARANHIIVLAVVDDGFHAQVFHAAFLKIIGLCEQHGSLGRPHGAISKVEFTHSVHCFVVFFLSQN